MLSNGWVRLETSEEIVGKYGSHSELSLEAMYDRKYNHGSKDWCQGQGAVAVWAFREQGFAEMRARKDSASLEERQVLFATNKVSDPCEKALAGGVMFRGTCRPK